MKIEEGHFYRRGDGRKAGPMTRGDGVAFISPAPEYREYGPDGKHYWGEPGCDLVAEWTDESTGPVRTVTRKEIVPGTYGYVTVSEPNDAGVRITFPAARANAYELREAIATLTEIAEALSQRTEEAGE